METESKKILELQKRLAAVHETMYALKEFGAADSEPKAMFQVTIKRAFNGQPFNVMTAEQWQLFADKKGIKGATRKLNTAVARFHTWLMKNKYCVVKDYLVEYCWRVDW